MLSHMLMRKKVTDQLQLAKSKTCLLFLPPTSARDVIESFPVRLSVHLSVISQHSLM